VTKRDVVIRRAQVVDGTGAPGRRADVAVAGGRIVELGAPGTLDGASQCVDADGLALAPGFIDMHSHADFTLPAFPGARNSITQGVTSEVVGNCGWSPAPLSTDTVLAAGMRAASVGIGQGLDWDWTSTDSFLGRLDAARLTVNVLPLVGHAAIRVAAMGMDAAPPDARQQALMADLLHDALRAGVWGLSTGLVYPPSAFAARDEVHELARIVAAAGGLYATHVRDEADGAVEAVREAIETATVTGVRVQISHLKAAGRANRGLVRQSLAAIEDARASGLRVACDVYPYEAMSTFLSQAVPPWALEGGVDELVGRLAASETRARIAHDMRNGLPDWPNLVATAGGLDQVFITHTASADLAWARGRWLHELAQERHQDPMGLALDLLQADHGATVMILFGLDLHDVRTVIKGPATVIGSDQLGVTSDDAPVHPRAYGSFARIVGPMVRDGTLSLEGAVHRMTGRAAAILGLPDRGVIRAGAVADLVLFDPATVRDHATYAQPHRAASGVEAVWVAGQPALEGGRLTGIRAGRVVRRPESAAV
jgi:N-acyl-D-amino-acid deacylase